MEKFSKYVNEYGSYHTKRFTLLTHLFGIPLIFLSIQLILNWIPIAFFYNMTAAWLGWLLLSIYYLYLARSKSLITILFLFILTLFAQYLATPTFNMYSTLVSLALFVLGVLCQLWGHVHEGKTPALSTNPVFIFIAPLFIITEFQALFR